MQENVVKDDDDDDDDHSSSSTLILKKQSHPYHRQRRNATTATVTFSTVVLCWCGLAWICAYFGKQIVLWNRNHHKRFQSNLSIRERTKLRTEENRYRGSSNYNHHNLWNYLNNKKKDDNNSDVNIQRNTEDLPSECERPEWQELNYPNCNDFHEIDLREIMRRSKQKQKYRNHPENDTTTTNATHSIQQRVGHIASGLWRDVFAVDPTRSANIMVETVALKMMKAEHDVDDRNFDRHRRDALVMEQLTASPYVVDIYGYCGNSVLTEYLDTPLDKAIRQQQTSISSNNGQQQQQQRIQWALDVAKGVQALHETLPGPIVHADLQSKQFLWSSVTNTVKINDFNRCRFMALHKDTRQPCPFHIPTAPGKQRAPEEYNYQPLDQQLDIYSTANILWEIVHMEKAWSDFSTTETKNVIRKGTFIPGFKNTNVLASSPDIEADYKKITDRAYAFHPRDRFQASELVQALQTLFDRVMTTQS
jgi:hypothetical protein